MSRQEIIFRSVHNLESKIIVGDSLLSDTVLQEVKQGSKIFYFIDSKVYGLHRDYIDRLVHDTGDSHEILVLESGESLKCLDHAVGILGQIIEKAPSKMDCIIAIGGGTVTDLAGFVSQLVLRGIRLILVPTTLLAQVDAAIGGKNGLNVNMQKNKVGSFYYPDLVICDTHFLSTLSSGEICNGIAEMVKTFAVYSRKYFQELSDNVCKLDEPRETVVHGFLEKLIIRAISCKIELLKLDPFEISSRRSLNFGHTIAHPLEEISEFTIAHGQAVLLGMLCETKIGELVGYCSTEVFESIYPVSSKLLSPDCLSFYVTDELLKDAISGLRDVRGGNVNVVLLRNIGEPCIMDDMPDDIVVQAWQYVRDRIGQKAYYNHSEAQK